MTPASVNPVAVVTAAGRGSRLGSVAAAVPKMMLPLSPGTIHGMLDCSLVRAVRALRAAGVVDIVVAAAPHPWFPAVADRLHVACVVAPPTGEYDAVVTALSEVGGDAPVIVVSSDNLFAREGLARFLAVAADTDCAVGVAPKPEIGTFTEVLPASGSGRAWPVSRLVEKPARRGPGLAKAGLYHLSRRTVAELAQSGVDADRFGERSMTEALLEVQKHHAVMAAPLFGGFTDLGTPEALAEVVFGAYAATEAS
jgi:dTDP-glucose pyrophosphorylase